MKDVRVEGRPIRTLPLHSVDSQGHDTLTESSHFGHKVRPAAADDLVGQRRVPDGCIMVGEK